MKKASWGNFKREWITKEVFRTFAVMGFMMISTNVAHAGLPWETPLTNIGQSLGGPVAKIVGVISIVMTGLMLAFGEAGGIVKRALQIVFGLSLAFMGASAVTSFFNFSGDSGL